ncbi:hypothetical protein FRB90_000361 [Tulasnella sp. 427]|nr:hypothetical protein FRB90_000361 [Tulasnella sp. 427]
MSRIDVPGTGPSFKWEPAYTGPPNALSEELEETETSPPASFVGSEGFIGNNEHRKDEVAEMRAPTNNKKRRLEDDETDNITSPEGLNAHLGEGSPVKKLRTALQQIQKQNPGFATDIPSFDFTFTPPDSPASTSKPLPPSACDNATSFITDPTRKALHDRRKARVSFKADTTTLHPKYGVTDSLYLHVSRLPSKSLHHSKTKKTVHRSGPDWRSKELERAQRLKAKWTAERLDKFDKLTCFTKIEERITLQGDHDGKWECWGDAVDRYEAAYPSIDLAGVRAKYLRPAEKEVRGILNKEATSPVGEFEPMRKWYPKLEHPAWDGVDEAAKRTWMQSLHYQVTHREVKRALGIEASRRSDRRMEMELAARMEGGGDGDTEVDESEDAMRRKFLEEGTTGEATGQAPVLQAPPPLEPIHPGLEMSAEAEARWESRWSAPSALPPTWL